MSNFSVMIKKLRNECHLTQEELAKKLGLTRSTIGMYETGKREPDFETLEKIADFFNVNMNYLLGKESKDVFLRIKKAMQHSNMDIQTFCDKIYSHPDLFYNWENNISDSYLLFLSRISKALNIPEEYFWGNMSIGTLSSDVGNSAKDSNTLEEIPDDIRTVVRDLIELPEEKRKLVIDMINMMSQNGNETKNK